MSGFLGETGRASPPLGLSGWGAGVELKEDGRNRLSCRNLTEGLCDFIYSLNATEDCFNLRLGNDEGRVMARDTIEWFQPWWTAFKGIWTFRMLNRTFHQLLLLEHFNSTETIREDSELSLCIKG